MVMSTPYERVCAVLDGRTPDRLPFITRLNLWHTGVLRSGTMPTRFRDLTLSQLHRALRVGEEQYVPAYGLRLHGVTVTARFRGERIYHERAPLLTSFPALSELAVEDRPGATEIELATTAGRLRVSWEALPEIVATGTRAYKRDHLIKCEEDYRTVEYILEHAEIVPQVEECRNAQAMMDGYGLAIPMLGRIPFQQALLEYLGEIPLFYALHDEPARVHRLLDLLDHQMIAIIRSLAGLGAPYVEFSDNLQGTMTNPRLFARYCLPAYQRYADLVHSMGSKLGSHTDGNLKPLLHLLPESGLDVCESFSPAPLTELTLAEAWQTWQGKPIIWGGIPSPILESSTTEDQFRAYIDRLLDLIGAGPIILGVADMILCNNSIDRVAYIAERVEGQAPPIQHVPVPAE
jgi:hypothetical protein